jgi:hypothetical protein
VPPSTMQDLLSQVTTDTTAVATDNAAIAADQAKLAADQATEATDTTALTADVATFSEALAQSGPFATIQSDANGVPQTVTIYSTNSVSRGYETQVIPVGSSLPIPAPPPPATPPAGS